MESILSSRSACINRLRPGSIRCHGEAPLGCGSGTRSKLTPARQP